MQGNLMPVIQLLNINQIKMKTIILIITLFCVASFSLFAQHDHNAHQKQAPSANTETVNKSNTVDVVSQKQLSQLLTYYYNVKNALVVGDAASASMNADAFTKTVNAIDYKV